MSLPFFPVYCIFPLSQATFAHDLLSSVLISFTATLCLSLPFVNQFPPVPTYSDSFCLSYFICPFLLNLSPSWDACPIFPNVPSSPLTLLHFPALSGQRACPRTKCFSSHLLGKTTSWQATAQVASAVAVVLPSHGPAGTNTGQHLSASPRAAFPQARNTGTRPAVTPLHIIKLTPPAWDLSKKNQAWSHLRSSLLYCSLWRTFYRRKLPLDFRGVLDVPRWSKTKPKWTASYLSTWNRESSYSCLVNSMGSAVCYTASYYTSELFNKWIWREYMPRAVNTTSVPS